MKVQIPFHQLLNAVKYLSNAQKEQLRKVLSEEKKETDDNTAYINMLLNGPVFTTDEIKIIEENRKSIKKWRTKN